MIRFHVLGPLDLRDASGRELRSLLTRPKRVALLAYLASRRGFHQRDTLLGIFWPESTESEARHALNQSLYELRRALGRQALVSRGPGAVGIDPERVWCDAAVFEQALEEARPEQALELYRDELLKGFFLDDASEFERWLEEARARYRQHAADAAWTVAQREEAAGNAAGAVYWARRAMALSRDDEEMVRRLLELLRRVGQPAAGVREYEAFAARIRDEYELEPDAATRELAAELRQAAAREVAAGRGAGGTPREESGAGFAEAARTRVPELPEDATPFVGRERQAASLEALLLDPGVRLLTIVGPAGAGKTRLALHVVRRVAEAFRDGAVLVRLEAVHSPDRIWAAIASALALTEAGDPSLERRVLDYARERQLLLVLDDMDHLVDSAGRLAALFAAAPRLKLLATSREALNLRGESLFPIRGLELPGATDAAALEQSAPVRLFLGAARRLDPGYELAADDRAPLRRILELVEGLPLAIELAASWSRVLSCREILGELRSSRLALENPLRDAPERHANIRAALDYSWRLLPPDARAAFQRLGVFRGGFTRESAIAVAGVALPLLRTLIDRSLVHRPAPQRYALLEVLGEYAREKLAEDAAALEDTHSRHADYFTRFLRDRLHVLRGPEQHRALAEIENEIHNVREAWAHSLDAGSFALVEGAVEPLFIFHDVRGWHDDGRAAFGDAAARCPHSRAGLLARLLARQGAFSLRAGRYPQAEALLGRALELAAEAGETSETAFILDRLGVVAYHLGQFERAAARQEESLRLRRSMGDRAAIATSLNNLGSLAYATGQYEAAKRLCAQALELQQQLGDRPGAVISLQNLACIDLLTGDATAAEVRVRTALAESRATGSASLVARSLQHAGSVAHTLGRGDQAMSYFVQALEIACATGAAPLSLDILAATAGVLRQLGAPGPAAEVLAFIRRHPAAEKGRRETAARQLRELREEAPAAELARAARRGRSLALPAMVDELRGLAST